ncbi:uncharacterized protein EV154DRAFT_488628 [Mucor mucedo]|uniref:uncharacterized protein n=1 Tax=Mucor mucedo TaxID=29922 RepID=UPI0022203CFC|nr:uncharacterized protein EV154DRAFT_488628 [Mucor mucedo]KAI7865992.1 hypothetical protein EV154DRAFT_488628 [Mucor mucedo]
MSLNDIGFVLFILIRYLKLFSDWCDKIGSSKAGAIVWEVNKWILVFRSVVQETFGGGDSSTSQEKSFYMLGYIEHKNTLIKLFDAHVFRRRVLLNTNLNLQMDNMNVR